MIVLGIETSCDETAASLIKEEDGKTDILSSIVSSQVKLHAEWGGVVPNLAAREHLKNMAAVLKEAFEKAEKNYEEIDLIAVTSGPGLIPSLLVGVNFAKTLSWTWKKPLIGIHHIEGHIYANFLSKKESGINFPILCLVVSGGHTQLVFMKDHLQYEIIGETLDDAAGEAFDKVARILGLGYPGGPEISKKAAEFKQKKFGIKLPRPMISSKDFNFSFSGLKTAVLYLIKSHSDKIKNEEFIQEVSHEFQQAVLDVLIQKTIKAAIKLRPKTITIAGGVSANPELRKQMGEAILEKIPNTFYSVPDFSFSIDNAAMIAAAGLFRWKKFSQKQKTSALENWKKIKADANLKLKNEI